MSAWQGDEAEAFYKAPLIPEQGEGEQKQSPPSTAGFGWFAHSWGYRDSSQRVPGYPQPEVWHKPSLDSDGNEWL